MKEYPFETLVAKQMPEDHDFMAWKLLYDVYHTEEGWIPANPHEMANDYYDMSVLFRVGVYTTMDWTFPEIEVKKRGKMETWPEEFVPAGSLIAHQRILRWPSVFMFIREYENIGVGAQIEQGRHVGEASHLVIHRRFRDVGLTGEGGVESGGIAVMIYKKQKELCELFGIKKVYTATTSRLMRVMRNRGLPFETIKKKTIKDLVTGKPVRIEVAVIETDKFNPRKAA